MLRQRSEELEIMDDLDFSDGVIFQTLKELKIINHRLGGNQVTIKGFKQLLKRHPSKEVSLTVADLGSGGGDMMVEIVKWSRRQGLNMNLTGIDANQSIIDYARENTATFSEISYLPLDVFSEQFKNQEYDIITCTLFMHHFKDVQLIQLFSTLKSQARIGIVINDLHRHWLAYYSIKILTKLFSKSYMVKYDAPLSVARSFRRNDWHRIFREAGITNYTIKWRWAFRWLVIVTPE
ncbi:methyltransferase domain-containing protein [Fulvivirgaceae bacterium BMA12]|uniref:Methyltransferase domain-containing protein n=1 Tax=Agaribacillus aureus TaxID=3051825 RepID=A0ABT8LH16_9BACT|nr:methyltransferase domain-containing protein [Fulvivirgaceae bacterium BMA12]